MKLKSGKGALSVRWSSEFFVVDVTQSASPSRDDLLATNAKWFVFRTFEDQASDDFERRRGLKPRTASYFLVARGELIRDADESLLKKLQAKYRAQLFGSTVRAARDRKSLTTTTDTTLPSKLDRSRFTRLQAAGHRLVALDAFREPLAVGVSRSVLPTGERRPTNDTDSFEPHSDVYYDDGWSEAVTRSSKRAFSVTGDGVIIGKNQGRNRFFARDNQDLWVPAVRSDRPSRHREDDGTTPLRFPSIKTDNVLRVGTKIALFVDLLLDRDGNTSGEPVKLSGLALDWKEIVLDVLLVSPQIDFDDGGRGRVTIVRNSASTPARLTGNLQADLLDGSAVTVVAQFMHGTRLSGVAMRTLIVGDEPQPSAKPPPVALSPTVGVVAVDRQAKAPDVTIYIAVSDPLKPNELSWQVTTARFEGIPAALAGRATLGGDTRAYAYSLFKDFATLEAGKHAASLEAFGDRLWELAPPEWRAIYWALYDHYKRTLTIQFISDEPYLPWELMRPCRADGSEWHPTLAVKHAVARWIRRWDGHMRNRLPTGVFCTIAPRYNTSNLRLARAQAESELLQRDYGAQRVAGTYDTVKALFESKPSPPVAVLHFAGHGSFSVDTVNASSIKLEGGAVYRVDEASRREVTLGTSCHTLVVFNACEIGATGSVLGEVGGWADALLGRQFGGFVAPLWAVEDQDASRVVAELMDGILNRRETVSEVLRGVRDKFGGESPTFLSYLFYGDVTARIDDAMD